MFLAVDFSTEEKKKGKNIYVALEKMLQNVQTKLYPNFPAKCYLLHSS